MVKKNILLKSLLFILCIYASGYGQKSHTLEQKIADAMRVSQPGWQLRWKLPATRVEEMECDLMSFEWVRNDGAIVQAFLWAYDSEEAAAARPREILMFQGVPREEWPLGANEQPVDGVMYSWNKGFYSAGRTSFLLQKKGKIVILVSGELSNGAITFLTHIVAEVPAT